MVVEGKRERLLAWEGTHNARDLGGYPTVGGGETRWGAIVRADCLTPLTEAGREALIEYGIRTIVDLRLPHELSSHPNPFAKDGKHDIAYHNVSLVDPAARRAEFTTLANDYKNMLDTFQPAIAKIVTVVARAEPGGVVIHCMGGKDRTGIVSALLLELAGVPHEVVASDYAISEVQLRVPNEEWLAAAGERRAEREQELLKVTPTAEVMSEVLAYLDETYGGAEGYLVQAGVARNRQTHSEYLEDIDKIRARLTTGRHHATVYGLPRCPGILPGGDGSEL